ncbi:MAG: hypothetical protein OEM81_11245 [Acidimicrobiia bacterium]|nr:hypothetical protein [Acidimicrobiia bacterium]MDH3398388.1 hypothetical protein [Acidimicrobiia bacterium]
MTNEQPDMIGEKELRAELGEILDQLNSLPSDAFYQRSKLRDRQNELSRLLREVDIPGSEEIEKRWSEAAAKGALEEPTEMIVSPMESGSGGGG